MNVLIVEHNTESQAAYGQRFTRVLSQLFEDNEMRIRLADPYSLAGKVVDCDLLVLGSHLGDRATALVSQARGLRPDLAIIMFVDATLYSAGSIQIAYQAGVRKVLSDQAPDLDILQEAIAVRTDLCKRGKINETKFIVVKSVKGGAGATSLVAALGEVCDTYHQRTLLWDLDVETRDLSRGLCVDMGYGDTVDEWMENPDNIIREEFTRQLATLSTHVQLLVPPASLKESQKAMCGVEGVRLVEKVVDMARSQFDVVIIDAGPFTGPAMTLMMRLATRVVLILGDSPFGVTAADEYLTYCGDLLTKTKKVNFLCTSTEFGPEQLKTHLDPHASYGTTAWDLPLLLPDAKARYWPGQRKTLYSMGSFETKLALEKIARGVGALGVIGTSKLEDNGISSRVRATKRSLTNAVLRPLKKLEYLATQLFAKREANGEASAIGLSNSNPTLSPLLRQQEERQQEGAFGGIPKLVSDPTIEIPLEEQSGIEKGAKSKDNVVVSIHEAQQAKAKKSEDSSTAVGA